MGIAQILGLVTTVTLLAACSETPTAPELSHSSLTAAFDNTVKMVPFRSTNTNMPVDPSAVVCPDGEAKLRNMIAGTGNHLGRFTGEAIACIGLTGAYSRASNTFIAANGDELWAEMDPSNPGQIVVFEPPGGRIVSIGGLIVTGGTGRFDGASGTLTFESEGVLGVPGSAVTDITGKISSPGSIKWSTP